MTTKNILVSNINYSMDLINENGDRVFIPLKNNSKIPLIRQWQTYNKTNNKSFGIKSNIGILCGTKSNIIIVDVDIKNHKEEAMNFVKKFDLFNNCNYIVQTTSGGYHFYYNYEKELDKSMRPSIDNKKFVDIQSNKTFCVAEGSVVNDVKYKCLKGALYLVGEMKTDLKNYLIEMKNIKKEKIEKIQKDIKNLDYSTKQLTKTEYTNLQKILYKKEFIELNKTFKDWFPITVALKRYDLFNEWDKWSAYNNSVNYNHNNNKTIWYNIDINKYSFDIHFIELRYKHLNVNDEKIYFRRKEKYEKILIKPENKLSIEYKYLTDEKKNIMPVIKNILNTEKCIIIKSHMGSGKTTMMNTFIKNNDLDLISIVSRRSLCHAQYKLFKDTKKDIVNYMHIDDKEMNKILKITTV